MKRRSFLRTTAVIGGAISTVGTAGCLGGDAPQAANEFDYPTNSEESINVPLVPVADAGAWHADDPDTVFADTRSQAAYQDAHIADAVFSPAPDGLGDGDPLESLDTDTRIVTYCVCPHLQATLRGESLIEAGYTHTYALDEGLQGWANAGFPLGGGNRDALHLDEEYHMESDGE